MTASGMSESDISITAALQSADDLEVSSYYFPMTACAMYRTPPHDNTAMRYVYMYVMIVDCGGDGGLLAQLL
jgi:hypothetical protein